MAAPPVDRPEGRVHQGGVLSLSSLRGTWRPHPTPHCVPRTLVEGLGQRVGPHPGAPPWGPLGLRGSGLPTLHGMSASVTLSSEGSTAP